MPSFAFGDHELSYELHGEGERPFVLMHGLLMNRRALDALGAALAERGNRVILLDLLGHGDSDCPLDMTQYSMPQFGHQVVGLLDHLGIEQAVIGGVSLGANTTLETAVQAPARVRGMVLSMPVLDNALLACALAFSPLLATLTFGEPLMRWVAGVAAKVPRQVPIVPWEELRTIVLDLLSQDPAASAAVLQGVLFGRSAPPTQQRRHIEVPALVIGHPRDAIHPFSDALMLVEELPQGRLFESSSIAELWLDPHGLTGEIAAFLDSCWDGQPVEPAAGAAAAS